MVTLRVVYFGTPSFAVPGLDRLLGSRHSVAAVVTQPDRPRGRGHHVTAGPVKALAESHGLPVLQPDKIKSPALLDSLRALAPDLAVVAAYGRILPDDLLALPRLGFINIHASLLPRYRGASPIQRAVINGERSTGVSIMRVVRELDAGPVFESRTLPIGPDDTSLDVEKGLATLGADALLDVIEALSRGNAVETPQDHERATYAAKLTREDGRLDWNETAERLHNRVRGVHPWPHAYTFLHGGRYGIHRTTLRMDVEPGALKPASPPPGTILLAHGADLIVAAGQSSALRILEIQPENKRLMAVRDFLAGHPLRAGNRFEDNPPHSAQ
jgi:methionyl-tRNA formyltransferase